MNTKTRAGLIVVLTFVLLLAVSMSAFARGNGTFSCRAAWKAYDDNGEVVQVYLEADAEFSLDGDILTRICTGQIPFGESPYDDPNLTYFTLDEMRDYAWEAYGIRIGEQFIVTDGKLLAPSSTDYKGETYQTWDYWLRVWDDGKSVLKTYYDTTE